MLKSFRILALVLILIAEGRSGVIPDRPSSFNKVYVVFAEEHSLEFVSGFGHAFICLAPEGATTAADLLLAPAVNFGVDTSPMGKGLFTGRYTIQPTFELVRKNTFFQQRRLIFFELNVSAKKITQLSASLNERIKHEYDYDFYRKNCGYYLADWLINDAGKSGDNLPGPLNYLTPRSAVTKIIQKFGVKGGWVINSPSLLAEERLESLPRSQREWLKPLHSDLKSVEKCLDLELKLLYLQMLESHANSDTYPQINAERMRLMSVEPSKSIAQNLISRETVEFKNLATVWPDNNEGPMFSVRFIDYPRQKTAGVGLSWESGLRDISTNPTPSSLLRGVHFISIESDISSGQINSTFKLFEIDTVRDVKDLFGVGSSGASVLFEERINSLGVRGICFKAWSGLGVNIDNLGWSCLRLHLIADEIGRGGRFRVVPEFFFYAHTQLPVTLNFSAHPRGQYGVKTEIISPIKNKLGSDIRISFERSPDTDSRIELGYFQRY